ncbi:glycosyl hydrolase family 16 [Phlyctema vagabunda]|uniref:Crh-like protein n=1 Tax=Phlyctema vagabunda TaxID=108571 RepID=A0ABR4P794_9HELO
MFFSQSLIAVTAALLSSKCVTAQTYSSCNPLTTTGCPANTALGKSISVDFTQGAVDSFVASGSPTYGSDGVSFTVAKTGDAPQLASIFYIMFGKVEVTMKAAPGAGIVSSVVLESDDLDEIDLEWLGADDSEVQTNYFGKGDVTTYNRGAYSPAQNNQDQFIKYTVDWTSTQIVWQVDGVTTRVLTPETADTNQYPQTPMRIKFGAWSGGDSSNPSGTIDWARGPTDYSQGPFSMIVQSIDVTDYSTGTQYTYGDNSGDWESIVAAGGSVNGNLDSSATVVKTAGTPAATGSSPTIPAGIGGNSHGDTSTQTGWPWVATATRSAPTNIWTTSASIPSGWVISSEGKIIPANSAAVNIFHQLNFLLVSGPFAFFVFAALTGRGWP